MMRWCTLLLAGLASAESSTVFFLRHKPEQIARLSQELERRSDPNHELYGKWLSRDEVAELLKPQAEHVEKVRSYLRDSGASWEEVGDKIVAQLPSGEFRGWEFLEEAVELVMPGSSAGHGGASFQLETPTLKRLKQRVTKSVSAKNVSDGTLACLAEAVDPNCLRSAYGIDGSASTKTGQLVAVNQGFKKGDISNFQTTFNQPQQSVIQDVGTNDGSAGDEASLDIEYIMTTGRGVPTTWVYLDGSAANPFANWLVWAAKTADTEIPKVHSLSVGAPESEVGDAIIKRMNTEMSALTARGVTIVFASGDSGYQQQQKYGAASPYVLSVGGVFNGDLGDEKLEVDDISTGGFAASKLNKAGKWQAAAINHYLTKTSGDRPSNIDATQRAVPDISAYDAGFKIVQNGGQTFLGGTSAAAPVVAGMLASINDALVAAGHSTLGFVNPFIYANEGAFLDVTRGDNKGIAAVEGYDPASGLGTFSPTTFKTLKAAALKAMSRAKALRESRASAELVV
eukprot:TRINITY_DN31836_c0_g1_i1.p1 TRINITY_DN31836_c0_g1~~TRINITY_DN31836_c0_g1_i1.p1  ORF type:complete len:513 (+),score=139.48 TRINITY_DN31836_c0_g1_i1:99-1637(+)